MLLEMGSVKGGIKIRVGKGAGDHGPLDKFLQPVPKDHAFRIDGQSRAQLAERRVMHAFGQIAVVIERRQRGKSVGFHGCFILNFAAPEIPS